MPARGFRSDSIPIELQIAIAEDPKRFRKAMEEWDARRDAAIAAEAKAREAEAKAKKAMDDLDAAKMAHARQVEADEQRIMAREDAASKAEARAVAVDEAAKANKAEAKQAFEGLRDAEADIAARQKALDERDRLLGEGESDLAGNRQALAEAREKHTAAVDRLNDWIRLMPR